ncbi:MAG: hypothetical protein CL861_04150 [Cyanobium sp. MED843]|nr:hypothetical protein [Cyanobium sp. MED843]OUW29186.1 MAG: hypothetical protein CBD37_03915 [Cyanobacteria bacterium TMED177]
MRDARLLAISWGSALLISFALRWWGQQHPDPLQAGWPVVLTIVILPALLLAAWLLLADLSQNGEGGESVDCDEESR